MSREKFEQSELFKYYSEHSKFIEFNGVNYKFNELSKRESQVKLACMTVSLIAINGAWSAWQEQQKVVDELESRIKNSDVEVTKAIRFMEVSVIDDPDFIKGALLRSYARLQGKLRGEP